MPNVRADRTRSLRAGADELRFVDREVAILFAYLGELDARGSYRLADVCLRTARGRRALVAYGRLRRLAADRPRD